MQCTFEHLSGSKKGQLEQVQGDRITVGRNPTNAVSFDPQIDLDVSGDHAQLLVGNDGKYQVIDLGSRNGTFVNGMKIAANMAVPVEPGSRIQFGKGGPEVKVAYTPVAKGPGKTRVELDAMKNQMMSQQEQAAASKKTMTIVLVVVLVLAIGGAVAYSVISGSMAAKAAAKTAKAAAEENQKKAESKKAAQYATAELTKAKDLVAQGDKLLAAGESKKAEEAYKAAWKAFDEAGEKARDAATKQEILAANERAKRDTEEKARQVQQRAEEAMERMKAEQAQREQEAQAKYEAEKVEHQAKLDELKRQADAGNEESRRKASELEDRINRIRPDSARAKEIIALVDPSLCYIYVESYVQPKDTQVRAKLASAEGTGFVVGGDLIATAKHVVQPWKYDPTVMATAKKYKDEYGLEIQDYVEVWMKGEKGFEKRFDNLSATCKVAKVMEDIPEDKEQPVTISWNLQTVVVTGIKIHKRIVNDIAIIQAPGASLKVLQLSPKPISKSDTILVIGTAKEKVGDLLVVNANPTLGTVGDPKDEFFPLSATVAPSFAGAPALEYDKQVWGIVVGTEASNVICLPIERVAGLLK